MSKILDVYFHKNKIGELKQNDAGRLEFTYSSSWLHSPNAIAISCSLPLAEKPYTQNECRAFFTGLLPEAHQRQLIAKNLGISASNDFSLLEKIGGECAGAITFMPSGIALPTLDENHHWLSEHELASKLRDLHNRPLLAGEAGVRLSLAGVQDKISVTIKDNKTAIPLNGAPSTHIIKPANEAFDGVIFNEAFCLELGRKVGLLTVNVELKKAENIDYLLIRRYDRLTTNNAVNLQYITRLHQEDFCQALGIAAENKYQNEGGPSLKQCFNLLRETAAVPAIDLNRLMDIAIFNVLIGNCDAHGKNFSLLYTHNIQLAPAYDLVSTLVYKNLSTKMAMKCGSEYAANKITLKNFEILADEAGLSKPGVRKRLLILTDAVNTELEKMDFHHPIEQEIKQLVRSRCGRILKNI